MDEAARSAIAWLEARGQEVCASCRHLDPEARELPSGLRYCHRFAVWVWPTEGQGCVGRTDERNWRLQDADSTPAR